jgi:hypothetical protein
VGREQDEDEEEEEEGERYLCSIGREVGSKERIDAVGGWDGDFLNDTLTHFSDVFFGELSDKKSVLREGKKRK